MPNCAAPMRSYKDKIMVEEDVLCFDSPPGNVKRWIGGFEWLFNTINTVDNVGRVACLQKNAEGKHRVELIFFSQGERLLFDKVRGWNEAMTPFKGFFNQKDDRICSAPNSVIVRVYKNKIEGHSSPVDEPGEDKVSFKVGDTKLYFNKERLCDLSSIFKAMFRGDYLENATSEIEPKNPGGPAYEPEEIKAFLEAMLPGDQRIPPNPSTVMSTTRLAHKYDVEMLLKDCAHSLKHAHEIPIIERLLLADRLQLKSVLDHLSQMLTMQDWGDLKEMEEEKMDMLNPEFFAKLFKRSIP